MSKRFVRMLCVALLLVLCLPVQVLAQGNVTYDGNAKEFLFAPGTKENPSDLFDGFKGVMPGDVLTQTVEVKNAATNANVTIYLRAAAAKENTDFLDQLNLEVVLKGDTTLFDAPAGSTDGLSDWACLGTFYPGGTTRLELTLSVPAELDNAYQNAQGTVVWEFRAEEKPIAAAPQTGDNAPVLLLGVILLLSAAGMAALLITRKRQY